MRTMSKSGGIDPGFHVASTALAGATIPNQAASAVAMKAAPGDHQQVRRGPIANQKRKRKRGNDRRDIDGRADQCKPFKLPVEHSRIPPQLRRPDRQSGQRLKDMRVRWPKT